MTCQPVNISDHRACEFGDLDILQEDSTGLVCLEQIERLHPRVGGLLTNMSLPIYVWQRWQRVH